MSGHQPQGPSSPLGGWLSSRPPWQWVSVGAVAISLILLSPLIKKVFVREKPQIPSSAAVIAGPGDGDRWTMPILPTEKPVDKPAATNAAASTMKEDPSPKPMPKADWRPAVMNTGPKEIPDQSIIGGGAQAHQPTPVKATAVASEGGEASDLSAALKPTALSGYKATRMAKPWATIAEGRQIACTSVSKMNSSLPGFVSAIVARDVYSEAGGRAPLIDRGSRIFGEISRTVAEGQERLFVLWRRINGPAPDFVRITLNSPAASELGEAGLEGEVNRHIWRKLEGALLLSGIETAMQALGGLLSNQGNSNSGGGGPNGQGGINFYSIQGRGQSLAGELLRNQVRIPDTITRDQGLPCSIFVSGDLVFEDDYARRRFGG